MKKLPELAQGARFLYGGVEWVKFEDIGAGTLCLAAEPVFLRAFDEENCNDWRKSSLRRELNEAFLDALTDFIEFLYGHGSALLIQIWTGSPGSFPE